MASLLWLQCQTVREWKIQSAFEDLVLTPEAAMAGAAVVAVDRLCGNYDALGSK